MKKGVTIKDIAQKLNMSVSTVSKALNNDTSISLPTRERVRRLATDWHYVPNEAARHFKQNKTFTVGLVIPSLMDQFYVLAINGVETVAAREKYNVIVAQTHEDIQRQEQAIKVMISNRVDGVILALSKNTEDEPLLRRLRDVGIPAVCMAREPKSGLVPFVSSSNLDGACMATRYLIKKGHRRIASLMGPENMHIAQVRLQGYRNALEEASIPYDPGLVKPVDFSTAATEQAMEALLQLQLPPTAVFCFKNYIALDAISYLKKNAPEKLDRIDFTGFGNLPLLQYLDHKPLASIEENSFEMGVAAMDILLKRMQHDGGEVPPFVQIPCELVVHR